MYLISLWVWHLSDIFWFLNKFYIIFKRKIFLFFLQFTIIGAHFDRKVLWVDLFNLWFDIDKKHYLLLDLWLFYYLFLLIIAVLAFDYLTFLPVYFSWLFRHNLGLLASFFFFRNYFSTDFVLRLSLWWLRQNKLRLVFWIVTFTAFHNEVNKLLPHFLSNLTNFSI